jgi:hypothetical protein
MPAGNSGGDRRRSYAWARHLEASEVAYDRLSPTAREGWEYALELAEDAKRRSLDPHRAKELPPVTIEQLAADEQLPVATISTRIAQARRQLFGSLTDAAIHKRCQRIRTRTTHRVCAEDGCNQPLPPAAAGNRHYCHHHGSNRERARRHRRGRPRV